MGYKYPVGCPLGNADSNDWNLVDPKWHCYIQVELKEVLRAGFKLLSLIHLTALTTEKVGRPNK